MTTTDAKNEDVEIIFGEPEDIYDEELPAYTENELNAVKDYNKRSFHQRQIY